MGHDTFEHMVEVSWSEAVSRASSNMEYYRPQLFEALKSKKPDIRSAAIASMIEGDAADAHDEVLALISDPSEEVRREVAEYLEEYGNPQDIKEIFSQLVVDIPNISRFSTALCKIAGRDDGLILDDEKPEEIQRQIELWQDYLREAGYL